MKESMIIGEQEELCCFSTVVAILGANVTITYNTGIDDARKLRDDNMAYTGRKIEVMKLDITDTSQINNLSLIMIPIFFASPKIDGKAEFNLNLFDNFYNVYCKSFYIIAKIFNESGK